VNMLANFMLPVVSWWDIYEQLHLIQDGALARSALPIRAWLCNHFTGRWIGRSGLTEWSHCDLFCGFGPKGKSTHQNLEHFLRWNSILEIFLPLLLLTSYAECVCLLDFISVCKMLGPFLRCDF
jgi:hypothetical protein